MLLQETPYGVLKHPLGSGRLSIIGLLSELLRTADAKAEQAILDSGLLHILLKLVLDYPFNAILHHQVILCCTLLALALSICHAAIRTGLPTPDVGIHAKLEWLGMRPSQMLLIEGIELLLHCDHSSTSQPSSHVQVHGALCLPCTGQHRQLDLAQACLVGHVLRTLADNTYIRMLEIMIMQQHTMGASSDLQLVSKTAMMHLVAWRP